MKGKILTLLLLLVVLLAACSELKMMIFEGESENWLVTYEVQLHDENSESTNLAIKFIGEDPSPQKIKYVVDSVSGKSEGEDSLNSSGVLKIGGHTCSGCSVTRENDNINATIIWNGKSENINLKIQ